MPSPKSDQSSRHHTIGRYVTDRPVAARLAALAGVSAVLLVVVGALGLSAQSSLAHSTDNLYNKGLKSVEAMDTLRYDVMSARLAGSGVAVAALTEAVAAYDPLATTAGGNADLDGSVKALGRDADEVTLAVKAYERTLGTHGSNKAEDAVMKEFSAEWVNWGVAERAMATAAENAEFNQASTSMAKADILGENALTDLSKADALTAAAAKADKAAADSAASGAATRSLALLVLGVAAALAMAWWINRTITVPLRRSVRVLDAVSGGDLTQHVGIDSDDELGRMAKATDRLTASLRSALGSISKQTTTLAGSSKDLIEVTTLISATAEETSAQSRTVSSAAEQITANISRAALAADDMTSTITEIRAVPRRRLASPGSRRHKRTLQRQRFGS